MKIAFFEIEDWETEYLRKHLETHELRFFDEPLGPGNVDKVTDAEVVSTFIYSRMEKSVIGQLSGLRMIASRSTGVDHIDLAECKRRRVPVTYVPSYGENTVAEHTFGLILSLSRNLCKACIKTLTDDHSVDGLKGFDLKDKTLGVIGTGRIGLHVIRIAKGFGMNVLAHDPGGNVILSEVLGFAYAPLQQLLADSDIVTLHVPYNKQTHHLINRDTLGLMKKGAVLINTARGGLVDTEALIEALDRKMIGGAGLDVLEGEEVIKEEKQLLYDKDKLEALAPLIKSHILLRKENVVYTPHVAFFSQEALVRILETTVENIDSYAAGNPRNVYRT